MKTNKPLGFSIECLSCGTVRQVKNLAHGHTRDCAACGYLGWTLPGCVTDVNRLAVQSSHSVDSRGTHSAARLFSRG